MSLIRKLKTVSNLSPEQLPELSAFMFSFGNIKNHLGAPPPHSPWIGRQSIVDYPPLLLSNFSGCPRGSWTVRTWERRSEERQGVPPYYNGETMIDNAPLSIFQQSWTPGHLFIYINSNNNKILVWWYPCLESVPFLVWPGWWNYKIENVSRLFKHDKTLFKFVSPNRSIVLSWVSDDFLEHNLPGLQYPFCFPPNVRFDAVQS